MTKRRKLEQVMAAALVMVLVLTMVPVVGVPAWAAPAGPLRISQVYGGGGNTGAYYTHDYIEVFNGGTSAVSLNGLSLQYASATGTGNFGANASQLTELPDVLLQPGQYYLVQEAAGSGGTAPLPTPDVIDPTPIAMAAASGKVALVTGTDSLGCNGGSAPCSAEQLALIIDLVGYGSANYYEGTGAAPTLSNTTAALRADNGCTDTDDNSADFTSGAPNPRNSSSPLNVCGGAVQEPKINEFVFNHVGTDTHEYVEVFGAQDTDYSALAILQIEGDSTGSGVVDRVDAVGITNADGLWVTPFLSNAFENGTVTLLLVEGFTGSVGTDLDADNDGVFDMTPWSAIVDAVAVNDGGADDLTYGLPVLYAYYDGLPYAPGGASRIPDGFDTDAATDWVRNDFDLAGIEGYPGTITLGEAYNTPGAPNEIYVPPPEACGDSFTPIYQVQGDGLTSPLAGSEVATEGIVVGDFQNNGQLDDGDLNGFHIQDPFGDEDPATSDGVFIYAPGAADVAVGDHVRVRGPVSEYFNMTQITASQLWVCSTGNTLPIATELPLPVSTIDDLEPYEGMSVVLPGPVYISEYFNFDRYGEIVLTTDRQFQPTAVYEPGSPEAAALALANSLSRITLDDGRTSQNPDPAIHPNGSVFDLSNLFRGGDVLHNVTGVLDYSFGLYRIQPTQGAGYTPANARTAEPDDVGGNLKVASFNVLNYFTTIDTGAWICGPAEDMECRGADTEDELARQRAKIVAALTTMNADVVGLIEIENHPENVPTADLVSGLNDVLGDGTYDYIGTGAIGTDAIRQAFIYKPATVSLVGAYAILDSSVDPRFLDDYNRPVLAQTFMDNATGGVFTVAVNHLKSKGSDCNAIGDPDTGDGQGNCNLTRKAAAEALVDWLAADPTGSGDGDYLIIGDLNSYDKEDPIDVLLAGGYTDLVHHFQGEYAYSYVFDGQLGYLDHALANADLLWEVTGTTVWHINADEPDLIDYDMSFKKDAQDAIYWPDAYRSSDHDPVIAGLDVCDEIPPTLEVSVDPDTLWPPNHKYVEVKATVVADDNFDDDLTVTLVSVTSSEPDDGLGDGDQPNDIVIKGESGAHNGGTWWFDLRAERSGTGQDRVYTITFEVTDDCGNTTVATATVTVPHDIRP
jgi:uncharacterized protein